MRSGQNDAYHLIVWQLARRIADFFYTHRVEPRVFKPDELRNVFQDQ
jgi:hypothetical protein